MAALLTHHARWQRYEEEFASLMTTFKLAKLIIIIVVIGHWLSCIFFGMGNITHDIAEGAGLSLGVNRLHTCGGPLWQRSYRGGPTRLTHMATSTLAGWSGNSASRIPGTSLTW